MPIKEPVNEVRRLRSSLARLARGTPILQGIDYEVKKLLKQEFATGEGPYGPWQKTARGRQALQSKRLPTAFKSTIGPSGLRYVAKSRRDFLEAHQQGHIFPARHREANKQFLTFNKFGRLIKNSKALNKKGKVRAGVFQTFARAHTVGKRVLPQRRIAPEGTDLPPSWEAALERGATYGMNRWYGRAVSGR